ASPDAVTDSADPGAPGAGSPLTAVAPAKLPALIGQAAPDRYRRSYALAGPVGERFPSSAGAVQPSWMEAVVVAPTARSATGPGGMVSGEVDPAAEPESEVLDASSVTWRAKQYAVFGANPLT